MCCFAIIKNLFTLYHIVLSLFLEFSIFNYWYSGEIIKKIKTVILKILTTLVGAYGLRAESH